MKKICHITSTRQNSIPRLLRESGTAVNMDLKPIIVALGSTFERDGIDFIGVAPPKSRLERMLKTSRILVNEGIKTDAEIYQLHDPELLPYAMKLKRMGKKVIFDSHEFYARQIQVREYLPKPLRNIISSAYKAYEGHICRKLDAVLAVCTINGKDYFENRSKQTVFLENLPDITIFNDDDTEYKSREKNVIYIGALSDARGITNLIKAAAIAETKLVLCGPFDSEEYRKTLEAMPEYKWVDYKGVLSRNEIANVLKTSGIGASTLRDVGQYFEIDTLPTKVYEYMALGLPVLISDTGYAKKLLSKDKFGVSTNPEDPEDMARNIKELISNPTASENMGKVGKQLVKTRFNWQEEEKKLIKLYNELLQ